MNTKDLFMKTQQIDDELRALMAASSPSDMNQRAQRIQDIATKFATIIIDLNMENAVLKERLGMRKNSEDET